MIEPLGLGRTSLTSPSLLPDPGTRGYGTPYGLIAAAKTIAQPTWMLLGGIAHGAATTMSIGYSVELSGHPFIVPPLFALAFGVLSGLGTSSDTVWMTSVAWDEIEAVLP